MNELKLFVLVTEVDDLSMYRYDSTVSLTCQLRQKSMHRGQHRQCIFSPEEEASIKERLLNGEPRYKIAEDLEIGQRNISLFVKRQNLDLRQVHRSTWTRATMNEIIDLYCNQNWPLIEISKRFNIEQSRIRRHLEKNGVTLRQHYLSKETKDSLIRDYVYSGMHCKNICAKYKVSTPTLKKIIRRNNLKREKRRNPLRPTWKHSSRGYEGWYKTHHFRSKLELFFIVDILEPFEQNWESGENEKYAIEYIDEHGIPRRYYPDFVTSNIVYEVKPLSLWTTPEVHLKTEAASLKCLEWNKDFVVIQPYVDEKRLLKMYQDGLITWAPQTQVKFVKKYSLLLR